MYTVTVVAKISPDGLLVHLDFMKTNNGVLDLRKHCVLLYIKNMNYEAVLGCYRLCYLDKCIVPAHSEVLISEDSYANLLINKFRLTRCSLNDLVHSG